MKELSSHNLTVLQLIGLNFQYRTKILGLFLQLEKNDSSIKLFQTINSHALNYTTPTNVSCRVCTNIHVCVVASLLQDLPDASDKMNFSHQTTFLEWIFFKEVYSNWACNIFATNDIRIPLSLS